MTNFKYEADIAWDGEFENVAKMMHNFNATIELKELNGPGGGNPCVNFVFQTKDEMQKFAEWYLSGEDF